MSVCLVGLVHHPGQVGEGLDAIYHEWQYFRRGSDRALIMLLVSTNLRPSRSLWKLGRLCRVYIPISASHLRFCLVSTLRDTTHKGLRACDLL
jgi:hypothetical protein